MDFDLSKYKAVRFGEDYVFIPNHFSKLQEKYLIASQLTLALQNKSVDNVLKTYMKDYDLEENIEVSEGFQLLEKLLNLSRKQAEELQFRLQNISFTTETISSLANETTFGRLETTMKSIHFHLKYGFYFESLALIRLLLEQLAYAYTASKVASGELKDFISPTKSLSFLKKFIPSTGKLYGLLSKGAHIDKSLVHKYIVHNEGENVRVITQSIGLSLEAGTLLIEVLKVKNIVFEYCFRNYLKKLFFIKEENKTSDTWEVNLDNNYRNEMDGLRDSIVNHLKKKTANNNT